MLLDHQGKIVIGGNLVRADGMADFVVLNVNPTGDLLWVAVHTPTNADTYGVRSMALAEAVDVFVTGHPATAKFASDGTKKWAAPDGGRVIAVDSDGTSYISGLVSPDFVTAKFSTDGSNLWTRAFDFRGLTDVPTAIALDPNGGVYVGGSMNFFSEINSCYQRFGLLKYSTGGNMQWASEFPYDFQTVSTLRTPAVRSIHPSQTNVVLTCNRQNGGLQGFAIARLSSAGIFSDYSVVLHTSDLEGVNASVTTQDRMLVMTGSRRISPRPLPKGTIAYQTVKATPTGTLIWSNQYVGPTGGYHLANAIALDSAGNVFVTGQSPGLGTGNDYATIKYNPDGQELWVQRYNGPGNGDDVATAIAVAPDGSVYVTGWSTTSSNLVEITTIKYVQSASLTLDTNRNAALQFPAVPGSSNRVQATIDFLDWLDLGFTVADTNGLIHFLDTNAPSFPFRFYRTVAP